MSTQANSNPVVEEEGREMGQIVSPGWQAKAVSGNGFVDGGRCEPTSVS